MEHLYPLRISGVLKSPIWGGKRLLTEWNKHSDRASVGESWELTVRRDEMSVVCNGSLRGQTVRALIERFPNDMMGQTSGDGERFPLLVKLIDAADRLSVQVHPDDAYAARVEQDCGKTELWYIVEADPGAEIICGLADGVTREQFAHAVETGTVETVLKHVPVHAGETYFIPSGLPHAIGKGILIAEIQQNCDLTYRVYDYDRVDQNGHLRELHVQKALDVIRPFTDTEIERIRYSRLSEQKQTVLADCAYFRVERLDVTSETPSEVRCDGYLCHLLCLDGEAEIVSHIGCEPIVKGDSYLLPAALESVSLRGQGTFLLSRAY